MCHPVHADAGAERLPRPVNPRARRVGLVAGCLAALLALWLTVIPLWRSRVPPPPAPLALEIVFPVGLAGRVEPLVTLGARGDGDFLAVRYVDEQNGVLVYDVWGVGGPVSRPFPLRPGKLRRLVIELPSLVPVSHVRSREQRPLRVSLDGEVLFDEPAFLHRRAPEEIFFGTNPIGGSLVREMFRGRITLPGGRVLRGGPEGLFGAGERAGWFVRARAFALLPRIALSAAVGWLVARAVAAMAGRRRTRRPRAPTVFAPPAPTRAPHRWFAATALVCTLAFAAVITGGTFRLFVAEPFSDPFDFQAASLLAGRLDLPATARSSESFVVDGKNYIYFGPTPAVLRLPLAALGIGDGRLSRGFMVAQFASALAAVYAIMIHVARRARGPAAWPAGPRVVLLVGTAGLGTTLFFLGSRAYVYHEAILCGAMFALWSGYCTLRHLAAPSRAWWLGAAACGTLAVHARPPSGLFALAMLGGAAWVLAVRVWKARPKQPSAAWSGLRRPILAGALAATGIASFHGVSYLKFKTFDGAPLKYHVQYQEGRLRNTDGRNFHLVNLGFGLESYLWRANTALRPTFPYLHVVAPNPQRYEHTKIDLAEPIAAMPYTMPALVLLAVAGGAWALVAWPEARAELAIIAGGALPMTLALFAAIAVSQRYTADFCPALILAAAFGLQGLDLLPAPWRQTALTVVAILAVIGVLVNVAFALHYQGEIVWGVSEDIRARYQGLRKAVDGFLGLGRP